MKKTDFTGEEEGELGKLLIKAQKKLLDLKIQNSMGKLKNSRAIPEKKREVARILTKIRSEELKV